MTDLLKLAERVEAGGAWTPSDHDIVKESILWDRWDEIQEACYSLDADQALHTAAWVAAILRAKASQ